MPVDVVSDINELSLSTVGNYAYRAFSLTIPNGTAQIWPLNSKRIFLFMRNGGAGFPFRWFPGSRGTPNGSERTLNANSEVELWIARHGPLVQSEFWVTGAAFPFTIYAEEIYYVSSGSSNREPYSIGNRSVYNGGNSGASSWRRFKEAICNLPPATRRNNNVQPGP